jgi:hypothetical protein
MSKHKTIFTFYHGDKAKGLELTISALNQNEALKYLVGLVKDPECWILGKVEVSRDIWDPVVKNETVNISNSKRRSDQDLDNWLNYRYNS